MRFSVINDLHALRRRRPRFGRQPDAAPCPALGQKTARRRQAGTKYARDTLRACCALGLCRREVGYDNPRFGPLFAPDDDYRPAKPFRRVSERRSSPDEGSARTLNRIAGGHPHPSVEAEYGVYAPAHVRTPAERPYLFPQIRASKSAIRHRDCPHCRGNGDRQADRAVRRRVLPTCPACWRAWRPAPPGWRIPDRPRSRR